MKICLAQTESTKGDIDANLKNHLKLIELAALLGADLIVFPELSITGYEPELAKELATHPDDKQLAPLQEASDKLGITVGAGMPIKADEEDGITISMLIFQPNHSERLVCNKCLLHADEIPYFVPGKNRPHLEIKGMNIAFGICYESLRPEHFLQAKERGADIYIASVAKDKSGMDKALAYFSTLAKEHQTPILMVNSLGPCDNLLSAGLSSAWNDKGELVSQLDEENQGLLVWEMGGRQSTG